jgi:L-serine kinase (ATP) / ParB family transcriptional regulator, heme-responsive regulator
MNAKELCLRIVHLDDVLLHEQVENKRVERLIARLQQDRMLKNPPIATQSNVKYIVLDGATRVAALSRMRCRDIVVQIVDYRAPGIALETWNHMLLDAPAQEIFDAIAELPDLYIEKTDEGDANESLARRQSIATIMLADGRVYSICAKDNTPSEQARMLNHIVAAYEGKGEMYRVAHTDLERLIAEHGRLSALVVFPRYRPDEIQHVAANRSKLPMGITRHIIPGRALRINLPLDVLESEQSLEEKNAWLDEWLKEKIRKRHVRFYQEPVFLFDE